MQASVIALLIFGSMFWFGQEPAPQRVVSFDVPDLPSRIDEPKVGREDDRYTLNCRVVNRSSKALSGFQLMLLVVEPSGKERERTDWSEGFELDAYSIKGFTRPTRRLPIPWERRR